jgi:hypothetical protein
MAISSETQAAADLLRSEQLSGMAAPQPTVPPVDYNIPYSLGQGAPPPAVNDISPLANMSPNRLPPYANYIPPFSLTVQDPTVQDPSALANRSLYLPADLAPKLRPPPAFLEEASSAASNYPETDPGLGYPTEWVPFGGPDIYTSGPYKQMTATAARSQSREVGPEGWALTEPYNTWVSRASEKVLGPEPSSPYGGTAWMQEPTNPDGTPYNRPIWDEASQFQEGSRGQTVGDSERGGLAGLADRGRYGDSMLVHMAPEEVAGLASLTQNGVTINPETGLPEMFNLASILPMILGIGLSFTGIGALGAAALTGLATAATTEGDIGTKLGRGLLAGVGSYALGGLFDKIGSAGVPEAVSSGMGGGAGGVGAGGVDFTGALSGTSSSLPGGAFPVGGAASQAGLGGFQAAPGFGGVGRQIMSATGQPKTWDQLPKNLQSVFGDQGQYAKGMEEMVKRVPPPPPPPPLPGGDWQGTGLGYMDAYVPPQPQLPPGVRQHAFERVFEKPIGEWQSAEAFRQAGRLDKLEYLQRGVEEKIDWNLSRLLEGETPPGKISLGSVARPAVVGLAASSAATAPVIEYETPGRRTYEDRGPFFPEERARTEPPPGYIPGVDPQYPYFRMGSGGLPTLYARGGMGGSSVMVGDERIPRSYGEGEKPVELAYVAPDKQRLLRDVDMYDGNPPLPGHRYYAQEGTEGTTVEAAAEISSGIASTAGIMQGAPMEVQNDVEARLSERSVEEPQNPRERAIYDRAVLALQNELEPEVAQRAIDEFLEVFGPDALHMLQEMVRGERENGGTVEPANGETTVEEGAIQGPDVIAGKIVDPVTGEETANLRVGENEYIEPAASLARRAQVAGLSPTPENGAMIRGEEERMLRQAVG